GLECAVYGLVDGVKLVISRHLLVNLAAIVLEDHKVADEVEKAVLFEDALDQHIQLERAFRRNILAVNRAPGHKALPVCRDRARLGLNAIRDYDDLVVGKEAGNILLVGLDLVECVVDRGVLVANVLELDNSERKAVDENQNVGSSVIALIDNGELI